MVDVVTVSRYRMRGDYLENVTAELSTDDHRNLNAVDGDVGLWVRAEDYDKLEVENQKLAARNEELEYHVKQCDSYDPT